MNVYTVEYCDHEGNLQHTPVKTPEDAKLEAEELDKKYDGVRILYPNGNEIVSH